MTPSPSTRSVYGWSFLGSWLAFTAAGGLLGALLTWALGGPWLVGLSLGLSLGNVVAVILRLRRTRTPVAPPLPELNIRLLRWVLWLMMGGDLLYLLAGWLGVPFTALFPWDALGLLVLLALAALLLRRGRSFWASSIVLGIIAIPIAFNAQYYGMASPVNALYVIGLLISGLVSGSSGFFGMLAAISTLTALFALNEQLGGFQPVYPVGSPVESLGLVLFWWALYAVTAWLSWLFARTLERSAQTARSQTLALAHTLNTITPDSSLDSVLAQTLSAILEQLGAAQAFLWLHDPAGDSLAVRLAHLDGAVAAAVMLPGGAPPPAPAASLPVWPALAQARRPLVIDDIANDPRVTLRALAVARGIQTSLVVPLLVGADMVGFVSIDNRERRRFSAEELELAQALVQQVTLTMQLARLAEETRQGAILAERNRMAREMHDTLAQGFTGIVVQLEAADDVLGAADPAVRQHLARARALARESLAEARRSVYALRLPALAQMSLPQALRASITALTAYTPLTVAWDLAAGWPALPAEVDQDLLRIAQEAVTNVLKHAQARRLTVALRATPETLSLVVSDDGRGIDPPAATRPDPGFGLLGMRERAARHAGTLDVLAHPGGGTTVRCTLPRGAVERAHA